MIYSVFTRTTLNRLWLLSETFIATKSYFLDDEQLVDKWNYGLADESWDELKCLTNWRADE
jgi:hypothetical protein